MSLYQTQDLSLDLGAELPQDSSMNMLTFPERGTTLVIARSPLPADQSFDIVYRQQLEQMRSRLDAHITEPQATTCGMAQAIQGLEVGLQFQRGEIRSHQRQLAYPHVQAQRLMVLSYSKETPLTENDLMHWQAIKASLQTR